MGFFYFKQLCCDVIKGLCLAQRLSARASNNFPSSEHCYIFWVGGMPLMSADYSEIIKENKTPQCRAE